MTTLGNTFPSIMVHFLQTSHSTCPGHQIQVFQLTYLPELPATVKDEEEKMIMMVEKEEERKVEEELVYDEQIYTQWHNQVLYNV